MQSMLHPFAEGFRKLRVFVAVSGLLVSIVITPLYVSRKDVLLNFLNVWLDYALWYIAFCILLSTYLDLAVFSRGYSIISTLLLDIVALLATLVSRVASWLYAETATSFNAPPIGGCIVDLTSLYITVPILVASYLAFAATLLHTIRGRPVVLRKSADIITLINTLRKCVVCFTHNHRILLLTSFTIGFLVRLYPELMAGPLPVGWDTWEYMAMARQFTLKLNPLDCYIWLGSCRTMPPLLTILMGVSAFFVDPITIAKLYPATAMGLVALLSSAITLRISNNGLLSLVAGLITSFNPYIVGQSQQWFRHILGAVVLLFYLYTCEKRFSSRVRVLALVLAALSYELSAAVAVATSVYELISAKKVKDRAPFFGSFIISLLLLLFYMGFPTRPVVTVTQIGIKATGIATYSYASVLVYTFTWLLVLIPNLVSLLIYRGASRQHRVVLVIVLLVALAPLVVTPAPSDQHRWFTLFLTLSIPTTCLGLHRLSRKALAMYVAVSALAGYAYVFTPTGHEVVNMWRTAVPHAYGFPWRLSPATGVEELQFYRDLSKIIERYNNTILVSLRRYPMLHYFIPRAKNIVITPWEPELFFIINYMGETKQQKIVVVTSVDLAKQRDEILNTTDREHYERLTEILKNMGISRVNLIAYTIELFSHLHSYEKE